MQTMRVGAFKVDFAVQEELSIAEVFSGKASLFSSLIVKNVRGSERDWMNITADINGVKGKNTIWIRDMPVDDYRIGKNDEGQLCIWLPPTLQPGEYECRLRFTYSADKKITGETCGEATSSFRVKIWPVSYVPTDLAHAPYLASWIELENDELRGFASEACKELDNNSPELCMKALYEELIRRNLGCQPVPSVVGQDFQQVSSCRYVLQYGGSCMDLSLLMASLLMLRGLSPVLLLYGSHITAGCFSGSRLPEFETIENTEQIKDMILRGQLILPEITDVCLSEQVSFADSLNHMLEYVEENSASACRLVNLKTVLRKGTVRLLPVSFREIRTRCPRCGYDEIPSQDSDTKITCPSCGLDFESGLKKKIVPDAVPDIKYDPRQIRYECRGEIAGVARCLPDAEGVVRILSRWKDKPVTYIAGNAFENSELSSIILPDIITEIKDRAFRGCEKLTSIKLPQTLSYLGAGAFSSSGLESIRIPGSVEKIPVLCFSGCEHLKTVILKDGIREIDSQAFIHCPNLEAVYIPASVKKVSESAFDSSCRLIYTSSQTMLD